MIEITNAQGYILAFNGRIIEIFTRSENMRMHIDHVESVDLDENKKGFLWIKVKTRHKIGNLPEIAADKRPAVDEFVAMVNKAKAGA